MVKTPEREEGLLKMVQEGMDAEKVEVTFEREITWVRAE